jgi:hypothetical protein
MKIFRDENQHNNFEKDFVVVHCWRKEFDIQRLILICFELRTLFDLKIKDDKTLLFIFKIKTKNKVSNIEHYYIYTFEKSIVNESRLSSACNRAYNCQNDNSETIKKRRRSSFRKRKFDILIRFI